jgi:hypothetical protein
MNFKRPENIPFPQVYHTFKARDKDTEKLIEYRIQDLPEEFFDKAIEMYATQFLPDEPMCTAKKLSGNVIGTKSICDVWLATLKCHYSLVCFRNDGSNEIVGMNVLQVYSKNDAKEHVEVRTHLASV